MSLFSRLDRVRSNESESGMFAVPDLGARDDQNNPEASPASPPSPASQDAPTQEAPAAPAPRVPQSAPPSEPAPQTTRLPRTPISAQPGASEALGLDSRVSDDMPRSARFEAPSGLDSRAETETLTTMEAPVAEAPAAEMPDVDETASEVATAEAIDESPAPVPEAAAPIVEEVEDPAPAPVAGAPIEEAPVAEAPFVPVPPAPAPVMASESAAEPGAMAAPKSPFDRLMAARAALEAANDISQGREVAPATQPAVSTAPPDEPAPSAPAPQSRFETAPPLDKATLDSSLEAADVAASATSPAPLAPVASAPRAATPAPSAPALVTPVASAPIDSTPTAPAASAMFNDSLPRPDEARPGQGAAPAPMPESSISGDGGTPGDGPLGSRFSARFAARESLDRKLASAEEPAPASTSDAEMARTGSEMARVEDEPSLSDRETKLRTLFRHKHLIFDSVFGSVDQRLLQNPTRETIRPPIERAVEGALREFNLGIEGAERTWLVDEFVRETTDVGPLVPLLDDPGVNKIIVTGANDVSIEKLGRVERTGISFRDDDHLLALVRRIAEMTGGRIDGKVPLLDRPLPDGGRIRAKVPPLAPQPTLTIEKSTGNPFVALRRANADRVRDESLPYNQLRERIQMRLLREFEGNSAAMGNQERLRAQVEEMINQVIVEERVAVTRAERAALVMDLLNEIVGLGPIEPLLNDPDVDEVMVNGPYQIYVERKGKLEVSSQRFRDNAHVLQVIDRIVAPLGRRVDEKSPMVDGRLRDGSRFNAIIPPLALGGPTMTIRKFARDPFTMTDLVNFGSLTRESAQFLQAAVEGRLNIVVSGGTGSGKTTTLNVLSSFIPTSERIVTIEDAAELQLRQEHVVRLETRPPNIEGVGEIAIRDLVRNCLRMRPDRIVVGECRGGEALDMLQAMNTGHDGSLTTAHSNGPRDTLKRMETMVMMAGFDLPIKAIREQIAMAVQLIVHQERMRDGKRRVTAVSEIVGMEGDVITMQDLFRFEQERVDEDGRIHGSLAPTGLRPKHWDTMIDNGVELSMELFHPRAMLDTGMRGRLNDHRSGVK